MVWKPGPCPSYPFRIEMTELEIRHFIDGQLEIRQGGRELRGVFPYNSLATVSDRLKTRKETFSPGAFAFSIAEAQAKRARIDLLDGHSFDRPLANTIDESVTFSEIPTENGGLSLVFEATLPVEARQTSYMRDLLLKIESGLARGISPGFRVPPKSVVANAETLEPEPGNPAVNIRRINQAVLFEMSIVTRAAYGDSIVESRMAEMGLSSPQRRRVWL